MKWEKSKDILGHGGMLKNMDRLVIWQPLTFTMHPLTMLAFIQVMKNKDKF